jgi:rhodanese-related sulfurtransferase
MPTASGAPGPRFARIGADELRARLESERAPLVLDVRRSAAFEEQPGVPTALPFALDRDPIRLPDVERERPIVAYCL